jgi:hypothetical protein
LLKLELKNSPVTLIVASMVSSLARPGLA